MVTVTKETFKMNQNQARIGIVTVSDRASRGDYEVWAAPRLSIG